MGGEPPLRPPVFRPSKGLGRLIGRSPVPSEHTVRAACEDETCEFDQQLAEGVLTEFKEVGAAVDASVSSILALSAVVIALSIGLLSLNQISPKALIIVPAGLAIIAIVLAVLCQQRVIVRPPAFALSKADLTGARQFLVTKQRLALLSATAALFALGALVLIACFSAA